MFTLKLDDDKSFVDQQTAIYGKDLTNSVTQYFRQSVDVCGCQEEERFTHPGPCLIRSIGNNCLLLISCRSLLKDSCSCRVSYDQWCVNVGGVFPDNASSGSLVGSVQQPSGNIYWPVGQMQLLTYLVYSEGDVSKASLLCGTFH